MASPGAVLASGDVKRAIRGPLGERLTPQGSVKLDKMSEIILVFALAPAQGGRAKGRRRDFKTLAVAAAGLLLAAFAAGGDLGGAKPAAVGRAGPGAGRRPAVRGGCERRGPAPSSPA